MSISQLWVGGIEPTAGRDADGEVGDVPRLDAAESDQEFRRDYRDGGQHHEVDEAEHDVFAPREGSSPAMHPSILHSHDCTDDGSTARLWLTTSSGEGTPQRAGVSRP